MHVICGEHAKKIMANVHKNRNVKLTRPFSLVKGMARETTGAYTKL